ncbi:MAG: hypothetical protein U9N36_04070 [Euryarchaeota archaeon]|nr:hypothetical protein [Euryarchaeota archaeon]
MDDTTFSNRLTPVDIDLGFYAYLSERLKDEFYHTFWSGYYPLLKLSMKRKQNRSIGCDYVLYLFIYSIVQWTLGKGLKETDKFVRNQVKKSVQNPIMRRVFFLFRGITEATTRLGGIL